jgi:L-cystine transport system permease protein
MITYALYLGPGQTENIRTAMNSVSKGQYEAGVCVGLTKGQTFRRIILPQALTVLLPVSLNSYLGTIKSMSLAFMVGVVDIMSRAKLCSALNFGYVEAYFAAAIVYWVLCLGLTGLFKWCERTFYRKKGIAV